MKFGQLILRRIVKIVATKCQILRLKCTKIDFGRGSGCTQHYLNYDAKVYNWSLPKILLFFVWLKTIIFLPALV